MNILIDPGHGAKAPGVVVNGVQEKNLNIIYAQMLVGFFRPEDVTITHPPQGYLDLSIRARESEGKDAMVSIHCNAASSSAARGLEIFIDDHPIRYDFPEDYDRKRSNRRLAQCVLERLRSIYRNYNSPLRRPTIKPDTDSGPGKLTLLREAKCPACLIEIGFMTNEKDMEMMVNPEFIFAWCEAVARGLDDFVNEK